MTYKVINGQIYPVANNTPSSATKKSDASGNFDKILQSQINKNSKSLKISAHAMERMEKRQITLEQDDIGKIEEAMSNLEKKGARETLMFYKDMALITSIRNRTIITAMKENDMDIVTNIDSAILIK